MDADEERSMLGFRVAYANKPAEDKSLHVRLCVILKMRSKFIIIIA